MAKIIIVLLLLFIRFSWEWFSFVLVVVNKYYLHRLVRLFRERVFWY